MMNITPQRVRKGLLRLLKGPSDVDRWDSSIGSIGKDAATSEHRQLFEHYLGELRTAVQRAKDAWLGELNGWASEGRTPIEAEDEMWATYPAGPAAQPFFVALVRRYWLACDALNKSTSKEQSVRPEHFLLGWLLSDATQEDVVAVLACMPYWPMGIDAAGQWK